MNGKLRRECAGAGYEHRHFIKTNWDGNTCYCVKLMSRYFAVHEPDALPMTNFTEQLLQSMLDEAKHRDDEYQQTINKVLDNTYLVTKTPWLRYNKWEQRFANEDMKELHAFTDLPNAADKIATIIANMVDTIAHKCWDGYHDCLNREWDLLPFWMGSVARDKESTKPFRSYIAPYTLTRYIGYWQSYILLCYRMYEQKDSRLKFTIAQNALLSDLQALMNNYTEDRADELHELLFDLSVALIKHSDYAEASSSLTYYRVRVRVR